MLALVAPSTMTAEQQTLWLAAAVDSLQDIRPEEIAKVSAEVRRSVQRHNQVVPKIAELVARDRASRANRITAPNVYPPEPKRLPEPPLGADEIAKMPRWLQDMGLRVGFLTHRDGRIVDATRSSGG